MLTKLMRFALRAYPAAGHVPRVPGSSGRSPCALKATTSFENRHLSSRLCFTAATTSKAAELPPGLKSLLPTHCCGCGIRFQQENEHAQGYFIIPKKLREAWENGELRRAHGNPKSNLKLTEADFEKSDSDTSVVLDPVAHTQINDPYATDEWDDWLDEVAGTAVRKPVIQIAPDPVVKMLQLTCVRCHKLANEGRVASTQAEEDIPAFDLGATVGAKIARRTARRAVVAVVVDMADFDGSLPRQALLSMLPKSWHPGSQDRLPFDFVLVANKMDVLPRSASHNHIENWVRARVNDAGLPTPREVHLVSCVKEIGVQNMLKSLVDRVGVQGDLWVIGAQNAGKSSVINALKYHAGTRDTTAPLTTAPYPGTTLDMVEVEGLPLLARSRCYDTPGVPHPFQLTSRFGVEEVKQLLARDRPLKPRTYRIGANRTVFIGGVCRIDVFDFNYGTVYLTVWASDLIPLHMSKTQMHNKSDVDDGDPVFHKAQVFWDTHVGGKLNPPGPDSMHLVPELVPVEVTIEGTETQIPQSDICIAGLGWVSCALNGTAKLRVWTPYGVAVTRRRAMLREFAKDFERPGWSQNSKPLFKHHPGAAPDHIPHPKKGKKKRRGPKTQPKRKDANKMAMEQQKKELQGVFGKLHKPKASDVWQ